MSVRPINHGLLLAFKCERSKFHVPVSDGGFMNRVDLSRHRVLVVGAKTHPVQLLRSVLAISGINKVVHVEDGEAALDLLGTETFQAVFCDCVVTAAGVPFLAAARRSKSVRNPMIAIFLLKERASRRDVEIARDSGATDVLTVPISAKTLHSKLEGAANSPRPFIVAGEFFGPDRRAKLRPAYNGADRRKRVPRKAKVDFVHL